MCVCVEGEWGGGGGKMRCWWGGGRGRVDKVLQPGLRLMQGRSSR